MAVVKGRRRSGLAAEARGVLARARSLDEALEQLGRWLDRTVRISRVSVRMLEPNADQLVIASVWSAGRTVLEAGTRMRTRSTDSPEVVRRGGPVVYETPREYPTLLDQILIGEGVRSWVAIPLHEPG